MPILTDYVDLPGTIDNLRAENERLRTALVASLQNGPEAPIDVDRWLALLEENERLRAALKPFAAYEKNLSFQGMIPGALIKLSDVLRAKRALEQKEQP